MNITLQSILASFSKLVETKTELKEQWILDLHYSRVLKEHLLLIRIYGKLYKLMILYVSVLYLQLVLLPPSGQRYVTAALIAAESVSYFHRNHLIAFDFPFTDGAQS